MTVSMLFLTAPDMESFPLGLPSGPDLPNRARGNFKPSVGGWSGALIPVEQRHER